MSKTGPRLQDGAARHEDGQAQGVKILENLGWLRLTGYIYIYMVPPPLT